MKCKLFYFSFYYVSILTQIDTVLYVNRGKIEQFDANSKNEEK